MTACEASLETVPAHVVEEHLGVSLADDPPLHENVPPVGGNAAQDVPGVSDYETRAAGAHPPAAENIAHRLANDGAAVEIDARLRFVEEGKLRFEDEKLEKLRALHLSPGETDVEITVEKG